MEPSPALLAELRMQEADRWARRWAIACGTAILVGFLLPLHGRATFLLWQATWYDHLPGAWLWPWDWLPLVVFLNYGIVVNAPLAGALAVATAMQRDAGARGNRLALCAILALVGWAFPFVQLAWTGSIRAGSMTWAVAVPTVAAAAAWGATRARARWPGARVPAIVAGFAGALLVAWIFVPFEGRMTPGDFFSRMPLGALALLAALLLGCSALASCLPGATGRFACGVARIAGPSMLVLAPWAVALAVEEELGLGERWPLLCVRWTLLWGGGVALGRVGVAAFLEGIEARQAAKSEATDIEKIFG